MLTGLPRLLPLLMLTATIFTLGSCGTTPPSRFYMLEPMPVAEAAQTSTGSKMALHIGIGPVRFAAYLDTSQIVTREEGAEINLSETHRWAEPLNDNFARILAQNLSMLLASDKVSLYPSQNWSDIDYQVLVNVWQLDATNKGKVTLVANWSIRDRHKSELLTIRKSTFSTNLEPDASYNVIVQALSMTVGSLSREIAGTIESVQGH